FQFIQFITKNFPDVNVTHWVKYLNGIILTSLGIISCTIRIGCCKLIQEIFFISLCSVTRDTFTRFIVLFHLLVNIVSYFFVLTIVGSNLAYLTNLVILLKATGNISDTT